MNSVRRILALAGLALVAISAAPSLRAQESERKAQDAERKTESAGQHTSPTLEAVRARWERLSPEEKERARERYEQYRAMSEEERVELKARARRLAETRQRVLNDLGPEEKERLKGLEPERQREVVKDLVQDEAREIASHVREKLPEGLIKRLEAARPEDRARYFLQFKRTHLGRIANYAIDQIGKRLELAPEEIARLKNLPQAERAQAVLELRKKLGARDADEFGLPPGITPRDWGELQALPPEQVFVKMQRMRREREALLAAGDAKPQDRQPGDDRPLPTRSEIEVLLRLGEAVRIRPRELVDVADLPPQARQDKLFELRRERCIDIIRENKLLPPERIHEVAAYDEHRFFEVIRKVLAPLRRLPPPPGFGERPMLPPRGRPNGPPPGQRPPPRGDGGGNHGGDARQRRD